MEQVIEGTVMAENMDASENTEQQKLSAKQLRAIEREKREAELEKRTEEFRRTFSYDGYQVVRKELFAHLRDPAITIRNDSVTFNSACISGLEGVVYIHMMFNRELKRIVVEGCGENDKDSLRWCIVKPDKRKSRKMKGRPFSELVYRVMGWDIRCRYKILGYLITFEGRALYVFDLTVAEEFYENPKRRKSDEASAPVSAETQEAAIDTRKGYYPDDVMNTFGVPVEQHREDSEFRQMDGYVSIGMLTGKRVEPGAEGERAAADGSVDVFADKSLFYKNPS